MPIPDVNQWKPPMDRVYRCPCGFVSEYRYVTGHRRGKKKHPDCNKGKIMPCEPGVTLNYGPHLGWIVGDDGEAHEPLPQPPALPELPPISELADLESLTSSLDDPEEIARRLNEGRAPENIYPDISSLLDGAEVTEGEKEYSIEPSAATAAPSNVKEQVSLPVVVRVMYDWARSKGWNEGDGTLSDFVTAMLLDHWNECMRMAIVVVNRDSFEFDMTPEADLAINRGVNKPNGLPSLS